VTTNPTAQWIAGQVTEAFPWDEAPRLSLCKGAPLFRRRQTVGNIVSVPILGGLHHQYVRV
jgi:hypothetical protein